MATTFSSHASTETVAYEQAVYGSFAFWDQGYAILAQSPGCRKEWIDDFRHVCQRYGERPSTAAEANALFCLKLPSGPWAIIGVFPQGRDDAGRPGALAFHVLFVKGSDYRRVGASPFPFAGLLRDGWTADDRTLPSGRYALPVIALHPSEIDATTQSIARAISAGRRVLIESASPLDDLAPRVWQALPPRSRARSSLATWAFSLSNGYHLVGMPRLPLPIEAPYVALETLLTEQPTELTLDLEPAWHRYGRLAAWLTLAAFGLAAIVLSWLAS